MGNAWRSFNSLPLSNRRHVPNLQNENAISPFGVHQISAATLFLSPPLRCPPSCLSLFSLSLSVYYDSSIKEQWWTERPPNRRDIPTISREKKKRGGVLAEVWKPSITEGLKLTSQQDVCIRMQIWAGYGQQMPSGAVKRAPTAHERPYAMWDSCLLTAIL